MFPAPSFGFLFTSYISRKRVPGFPLLCVFVLLLHGLVQWSHTDRVEADCSAISLGACAAHQIPGWSIRTCSACLWAPPWSQPCDHQWFKICWCTYASSSPLRPERCLGSMAWWGPGACLSSRHCCCSWKHLPGPSRTPPPASTRKDGTKSSLCISNNVFPHLPSVVVISFF